MINPRVNKPGYRFDNGHVVGSSGIARPRKYAKRHQKALQHQKNLQARAGTTTTTKVSKKKER